LELVSRKILKWALNVMQYEAVLWIHPAQDEETSGWRL
jgi:hypothetical protein